jgi:hypothetical protein
MARFPGFIGSSYRSQSPIAAQERTVNFYTERIETPGAKAQVVLYPTSGVEVFSPAGNESPGRAMYALGGRMFAVIGPTFYEIGPGGVRTVRGVVAVDANPATIVGNGDGGSQLFITSGDKGYCFDLGTNVLTEVRASGNTMGAMLDGYFLVFDAATSAFFASDLLDGMTWDPLQFQQRTMAPDPWVAMLVNLRDIWLFGSETTEVWYDAGTSPFPFQPNPVGVVQFGVAAPFSPARVANQVAWLGQTRNGSGEVILTNGYTPQVISNYALQFAFSQYPRLDDAVGWSYEDQGHTFYVLEFPSAGKTWVFDLATGEWCERGTWIAEDDEFTAWRPRHHAYAFGQHLVADRETGAIYRMAIDLGHDVDGRELRRIRRAPALSNENKRIFFDYLELELEPGLGLPFGQGSDPQVELRISRDGGKTFFSAGTRSAGKQGEYRKRVRWTRLGSGRDNVFEIVCSDPIPWRIIAADLQVKPGRAA